MRWHLLILTAAGILAGPPDLPRGGRAVPPTDPEPQARPLEVARLRAHFDSVDVELRQNNALHLTLAQRTVRVTFIGWLRDYREAGAFPQNDRFPEQAMPFFRDSRGVLCAMAYLIDRSGRHDLVDRVALTRNNAFIPELAGDRELRSWLDSVGLSVAEAARIQPAYEPSPDVSEDHRVSTTYAVTSLLVSGASLTTLGLNLVSPSKSTGWAGVIAGSAGIIAGAVNIDGPGASDDVAAVNMIAGGGALAFGLYRLLSPRPSQPADGRSQQDESSEADIAVSPVLIPASGSPRLGLVGHASF